MKRRKLTRTGQIAVNFLERCLTLTGMAEQRLYEAKISWFAYLDIDSDGCPDDYAHGKDFGLNDSDHERFLDWCANQRHFWLLCEAGQEDIDAHHLALSNRALLRSNAYP